jgi:endonuclease-3
MSESSLKELIREVNFNATKAKNIIAMAEKVIVEKGGKMPESFEGIQKFKGVGEKIALLYMLVGF